MTIFRPNSLKRPHLLKSQELYPKEGKREKRKSHVNDKTTDIIVRSEQLGYILNRV